MEQGQAVFQATPLWPQSIRKEARTMALGATRGLVIIDRPRSNHADDPRGINVGTQSRILQKIQK